MNLLLIIISSIFITLLAVVAFFFARYKILNRKEEKQGWRTRSQGRSGIKYGQKTNGQWNEIDIDGEMIMSGKKNLVLYIGSEKNWIKYPIWLKID